MGRMVFLREINLSLAALKLELGYPEPKEQAPAASAEPVSHMRA